MSKNDEIYQLYRFARKFIERAEACCEKDHAEELKHFKDAVEMFDSLGRGYDELYAIEKATKDVITQLDKMCLLVDKFAKEEVTPGTPLYDFQQGMIASVKRYREKKKEKENAIV